MHSLNGKSLSACSFAELDLERETLMRMASTLTIAQRGRLIAVERELGAGPERLPTIIQPRDSLADRR